MAISLTDFVNQTDQPMRAGLVQKITNESLFMRRLRFIQVDGFSYRYNRQETLGGIAFRNVNESYTNDVGVVNPLNENLAILGGEVRSDRQLVQGQGAKVRANNIMAKVRKAGLFYDKYVIDGDPGVDPKQFYGLNPRLTGDQVIAAGVNGAALTLAMVDEALDKVVGTNGGKVIVCNKVVRRKITTLAVAAAGGASVLDVGNQRVSYNGADIEVIDEDGDEAAILGFDETQGSSNVTTSLYVIRLGSDTDEEYVQGLIGPNPLEHVDVGLMGTYYSDIVEARTGLAMFHPRSACRLKGILNA